MWKRWVLAVAILLSLCAPSFAHKNPIVEYAYVGHIWEEAYTTIPRQPVVGERIVFKLSVEHPNETIDGNVTGLVSIYRDDTTYQWYGGKSYRMPDWLLIKEAYAQPTDGPHEFTQDVVIGEPGSYHVLIDWYEDRQYIGQSMHTLDVETRTTGPLFLVFSGIVVLGVIVGVRKGVL